MSADLVIYVGSTSKPPTRAELCARGVHRWAWLVDGRQACGYCGRLV